MSLVPDLLAEIHPIVDMRITIDGNDIEAGQYLLPTQVRHAVCLVLYVKTDSYTSTDQEGSPDNSLRVPSRRETLYFINDRSRFVLFSTALLRRLTLSATNVQMYLIHHHNPLLLTLTG